MPGTRVNGVRDTPPWATGGHRADDQAFSRELSSRMIDGARWEPGWGALGTYSNGGDEGNCQTFVAARAVGVVNQARSSTATSSAIWTALSAAPLRRLSLEQKRASPCSTVSSARMRPTNVGS